MIHQGLVVRVDHEHPSRFLHVLEHLQQVAVVVDARTGRMGVGAAGVHHHVHLEGRHPGLGHGLGLAVGGHRVVVVVHDAPGRVEVEDLLEMGPGHGGGIQVGHPEDGRHPACSRGLGAGDQVFLVRIAGLPGVDVDVHHAGQHQLAGGVHHLLRLQAGSVTGGHLDDPPAGDPDVRPLPARAGYEGSSDHRQVVCHVVAPRSWSVVTGSRRRYVPNQSVIWGTTVSAYCA